MHKTTFLILLCLLALFGLSGLLTWQVGVPVTLMARPEGKARVEGENFPRTLIDSYGYRFTLKQPPQRIVSAMLASDEILLDLVGPERLLAVTRYATDPEMSNCVDQAQGLRQISDLSLENLLALQPDLILAARFAGGQVVAQLRQCRMPIFCFGQFDTLDDIRDNVLLLGAAVAEEKQAAVIADWMDAVLQEVRRRTAGVPNKPRVLYYYLRSTAGKDTIFDELVQLAGGVNVAAEANISGIKSISPEVIPALNPDVVIVPQSEQAGQESAELSLMKDPIWKQLLATGKVKVHALPPQHLNSISHHVVKAAAELGHVLHPDRVPAALPVANRLPN